MACSRWTATSAPVDKLAALAEKYGAIMMVDDAHASGVLGRNGRGSVDHFGMHGKVDVQVGTLSKAIGALGGYVCGSKDLIDYLYHRARPFLFSTSHPPSVRGHVHCGLRHPGEGTGADSAPVVEYALLPGRAQARRVQHRRRQHAGHRNADHADHRRRGPCRHGLQPRAV